MHRLMNKIGPWDTIIEHNGNVTTITAPLAIKGYKLLIRGIFLLLSVYLNMTLKNISHGYVVKKLTVFFSLRKWMNNITTTKNKLKISAEMLLIE